MASPQLGTPPTTNAQVLVGTVTPDGTISKFENNGTWADYLIINRYEKDRHTYMMGLTSPGGATSQASVAFVQLAFPTLLWVSDWTAAKWTNQPEIPNPTSYDSSWILLDEHYEPAMIAVGSDGVTPFYRLSGTYIYGKTNPSAITVNNITFARPPYIKNTIPRNMPTSKLTPNLSNTFGRG